ncbi:YlaI family protein [Halalkalibacter kiskunsagensis]|uniref:YlaI family protein n=1 Tax=Halalkalibacter kiskunsagensis TaxID=1548599 RepID=A0ABV6KIZ5_9BACI
MRVKCVLCDKIDKLDDHLPLAKRLRNRPIHTYMCDECYERIRVRTEARKETGLFQLTVKKKEESEWL